MVNQTRPTLTQTGRLMNITRNKGIVSLTILGILIFIGVALVFGYVIALSVAAGLSGGSITAWLSNGLQRYPSHYIDVRETD